MSISSCAELVLHDFVVCLDTGGETMVTYEEIMTSTPYTKKKGVSPMARLEDVRLAHSAHKNSLIHLVPCFFKQS
jgi:hypothetical protein